jgi:hypothetical protein
MPNGQGILVNYRSADTGYRRAQVGFVATPVGQFHPITQDTNFYRTLTISPDGKTLATVQERYPHNFYLQTAANEMATPGSPALAPDKDLINFAWVGNQELLLDDSTKLFRAALDGSNRRLILQDLPQLSVHLGLVRTAVTLFSPGEVMWKARMSGA